VDTGGSRGDGRVVVFPKTLRKAGKPWKPGAGLPRRPLKFEEQGVKIHADEVFRMENVRERLAKSVHFHLLLDRMNPGTSRAAADDPSQLREKKGFLHAIRPGEFDAVISLPTAAAWRLPWSLRGNLRGRFGYDVLRLTDDPESRKERALLVYAHGSGPRTGGGAPRRRGDGGAEDLVLAAGAELSRPTCKASTRRTRQRSSGREPSSA